MRKLQEPFIIINFKTYAKATGDEAVKLAKLLERVARKEKKTIAVAVQPIDIYRVDKATRLPILSQHIDPIEPGAHTGHILPEDIAENGAVGTLINHSEDGMNPKTIMKAVQRAKDVGLLPIVCARDLKQVKEFLKYEPSYIAYEPPELIGTRMSVTEKKGGVVEKALKILKPRGLFKKKRLVDTKLIVGAGIHSPDDLAVLSMEGVAGALISNAIVNAVNPEKTLREMLNGIKPPAKKNTT